MTNIGYEKSLLCCLLTAFILVGCKEPEVSSGIDEIDGGAETIEGSVDASSVQPQEPKILFSRGFSRMADVGDVSGAQRSEFDGGSSNLALDGGSHPPTGATPTEESSLSDSAVYGPKDDLLIPVVTDELTPAGSLLVVTLIFEDGQQAGQSSLSLASGGASKHDFSFSNPSAWPLGKYNVYVTLNGSALGTPRVVEVR